MDNGHMLQTERALGYHVVPVSIFPGLSCDTELLVVVIAAMRWVISIAVVRRRSECDLRRA